MRYFFKQLSIFVLPLFIIVIALYSFLYYANHKLIEHYKINHGVNKLIIGDSHSQRAIDDKLLPNSLNLSQSAEGFIYSYYKMQSLLKNNPQIDTVFLGVSYHSFSSYYDDFIYYPVVSADYFFILPVTIQFQLLTTKKMNTFDLLLQSTKRGIRNLFTKKNYSFTDTYTSVKTDILLSDKAIAKRIKKQYFVKEETRGFSESNLYYYNKIIELCRNNNIKLIGLNTPMHTKYKERIPVKFIAEFESITKNSGITLIEFNQLQLNDSDYLPDGDHVTENGAKTTTNYLRKILKSTNIR